MTLDELDTELRGIFSEMLEFMTTHYERIEALREKMDSGKTAYGYSPDYLINAHRAMTMDLLRDRLAEMNTCPCPECTAARGEEPETPTTGGRRFDA